MKLASYVLLATIVLASCGGSGSKEELLKQKYAEFNALRKEISQLEMELRKEKGDSTAAGKPVRVTVIQPTSFVHSIDIQGRIDAEESVSVGPQMPGLVKRVLVQAGDKVAAGQTLAELDTDAMNQQLSALKLQRDLAKQVYDRQKNLWDQKIGTELQFLQTKTQYEALNKQVAALEEQIAMARVTSPIGGTVDAVGLKVGEMASPGFTTIQIVNTGKLRAKGEVAEGYISKVRTGSDVAITLPDADNKTIQTKVTHAGRIINKLNRTFNVEVALAPNEENVVPNMIAVIKITDYKNDSAKVVPLAAIQQGADGKTFVYVAATSGGKTVAEKRDVTYTFSYNGKAEITAGLSEGDRVITEGYADLTPGDVLTIQE
jgi:membrane fusion protein (multidrug efflux system)